MALVEIRNVTKVFDGDVWAIKDASLNIEDREFVVLVGPSGCGKSTLLRMIAGLDEVTSGEIYIGGKLVNDIAPKNRNIAMVFQNYALYPHMTVAENLGFGLRIRKYPKEEIKKRVLEAAEVLKIQDFLDRKPKALSGGQRQRVALGRALIRKPNVFLFDEPLSNLDAKLRVQMRLEIIHLQQLIQTTTVYVTHDQIEAMTMSDKIVVLNSGVIQQVDSAMELYNNPTNKFVAGFIGSPAMNFFQGDLVSNGALKFRSKLFDIDLPDGAVQGLKDYPHRTIVAGIRPEHMLTASLTSRRDKATSKPQTVTVDVVEPVGNEVFVYFSEADQRYCMRMSPERLHHPGEEIQILIELEKIYFFDIKSDKRYV